MGITVNHCFCPEEIPWKTVTDWPVYLYILEYLSILSLFKFWKLWYMYLTWLLSVKPVLEGLSLELCKIYSTNSLIQMLFVFRDFAYVARDKSTRKHMCHVFRCDTPARQIANTLRDICKKIMMERTLMEQGRSLQRMTRPTDLPNLEKNGQPNGQKLTFQNLYNSKWLSKWKSFICGLSSLCWRWFHPK